MSSSPRYTLVALLGHRKYGAYEAQIFVRYSVRSARPVFSVPHRRLHDDEDEKDCAIRVAKDSLGIDLTPDQLSAPVTAEDHVRNVKIVLFAVQATREMRGIARMDSYKKWRYALKPLSHVTVVFLYGDIKLTCFVYRQLIEPSSSAVLPPVSRLRGDADDEEGNKKKNKEKRSSALSFLSCFSDE
ncbi:hypothetical protein GGS20DRAFT_164737 [Poronia punctata]|nr:hypothetical protein GGS20DRAFT_164737 [Poronia punctata]